jgi:hypothetical protein
LTMLADDSGTVPTVLIAWGVMWPLLTH